MSPRPLVATLAAALVALPLAFAAPARAADEPPPADVLELEATVSEDVAPDVAVVTLAVVREGTDVASLTRDVNEVLRRAFADAKATPGVVASNGGYGTQPRYELRNNQNVRTGWQVRAEIVLRSKDLETLGALAGRLSQSMQVASTGFEVSPELRARESDALVARAAQAFQAKAAAASKAFGYSGYAIRYVRLGAPAQPGVVRPMMMRSMAVAAPADAAAPLPVEAGLVTMTLSASGTVQMRR